MLGKGEKRLVAAYSAAHFAVDLCCAMLVLPAARAASDKAMALLIYNFCAFAMQLPIGVLADRYGGGRYFSAIGCLMVALGGLLPSPMLTAVVCGLGNAAFHIGGGADVMAVTEGQNTLAYTFHPGQWAYSSARWPRGRGGALPLSPPALCSPARWRS